jgi:hypothetical protein
MRQPWYNLMSNTEFAAAIAMPHQQDSPKHWQRWLEDRGVAEAVARHVNDLYRTSRSAAERVWTFAYVGATSGAVIGVLAAAIFIRWASGRWPGWPGLVIMVLAAALTASLAWWGAYWLMHRSGLRTRASQIAGRELTDGDECVERVIGSLADELARSRFQPRGERSEMEQLTQATIVTGLREAPTSELERNLLERLVGSAFVPTADGSIFVFKPGPPCSRCAARTRTGPLRLLNIPSHWAAQLGYERLRELPTRGRHLLVVPQRIPQLAQFLGHASPSTDLPMLFGPKAQVLLCEGCGKEAVRDGVLQERDQQRHS